MTTVQTLEEKYSLIPAGLLPLWDARCATINWPIEQANKRKYLAHPTLIVAGKIAYIEGAP